MSDPLEYARPHSPQEEAANRAARSDRRWGTFRKIRLILRVIYLVVCLGLLVFAWKYIQQYIETIENAGKPL
ncbi:MAG: hypothetical protein H0T11_06510 [Chthoniobacterales bacterium]|nr:hypothetical protein [Chthoniobacterales bacterium]